MGLKLSGDEYDFGTNTIEKRCFFFKIHTKLCQDSVYHHTKPCHDSIYHHSVLDVSEQSTDVKQLEKVSPIIPLYCVAPSTCLDTDSKVLVFLPHKASLFHTTKHMCHFRKF